MGAVARAAAIVAGARRIGLCQGCRGLRIMVGACGRDVSRIGGQPGMGGHRHLRQRPGLLGQQQAEAEQQMAGESCHGVQIQTFG